jgi:translation initiation factor 2D
MKGLVGKLLPSHSIQTSPDLPPRYFNGHPPQVDISVVQVRGNKNMTHIAGLESFGIDLDELAREFRQKFAASSTVGPSASNPRITEVCIQGHLGNEAVEFLVKTYSMPRNLLSVSLKKGVKAKKT